MNQTYQHLASLESSEQSDIVALEHYRLFQIKGIDAQKFLQGQLTSDLKLLAEKGHSLSAHCNIKGHIFGLFRLFRLSDEHYLASVHSSIAETGFNNLKKYSIFSKVELSFLDDWSGIAVTGEGLKKLGLADATSTPVFTSETLVGAQLDDDLYEIWGSDAELLSKTKSGFQTCAPESVWNDRLIRLGIPSITAQTQEHFIPQMVNLQALDGVSFSKGCYTGQEIVTRLQHRGILKKAMYPFQTNTDSTPEPGQAVYDLEGTEIGEIVSAASDRTGLTRLLAVIQQSKIDENAELKLENGSPLTRLELPYTLDPRMFEKKR